MTMWAFFEALLPFVIFALVQHFKKNTKLAISWALAVGAVLFLGNWVYFGAPDKLLGAELVLLVFFGWFSSLRDDPLWFKLQPVAMAALVTIIGAYIHFFEGGIAHFFKDYLIRYATDEVKLQLQNEDLLQMFDFIFALGFMVSVPIHAALVAVAAYRWSDATWLFLRAVGLYPIFLAISLVGGIIYRLLYLT